MTNEPTCKILTYFVVIIFSKTSMVTYKHLFQKFRIQYYYIHELNHSEPSHYIRIHVYFHPIG